MITSHVLRDLDEIITQVIYLQDGKLKFHKSFNQLKEDTGELQLSKSNCSCNEKQLRMKKLIKYVIIDILRNKVVLGYTLFLLVVSFSVFNLEDNTSKGLLSLLKYCSYNSAFVKCYFFHDLRL